MAGREGADFLAQADEVLGLAGEHDGAVLVVTVEQRPDTDGIPGCDEGVGHGIVDDEGELGVQPGEHGQAVFPEQGQQNLTVAAALELIAFFGQLPLQGAEAVNFAVADHIVAVQLKGLHTGLRQAHDGQAVEAEVAGRGLDDAAHVGAAGNGAVKIGTDLLFGVGLLGKTHDGTHTKHLQKMKNAATS